MNRSLRHPRVAPELAEELSSRSPAWRILDIADIGHATLRPRPASWQISIWCCAGRGAQRPSASLRGSSATPTGRRPGAWTARLRRVSAAGPPRSDAHEVEHVAVPLGASVERRGQGPGHPQARWTRPRSISQSPSRRRRVAMSGGRRAHRRDRTQADWLPARPARHRSRSRPRHRHRREKPKCSAAASATPSTIKATKRSTWATTPHRQDGAAYATLTA